ncbi:hypothetical protein [Streptomyces sp. NBC_01197]|uniref:hypothetical protein n=1 Tax=Streptomyces sp. NBC_01197 TaxID=2903768 RepID=UPI002E13105A|nr:hypothetical protein OG452_07090 [Streptomyces sp. NBC_01197]
MGTGAAARTSSAGGPYSPQSASFAYGINQITGAIEYVDLQVVEEGVLGGRPP